MTTENNADLGKKRDLFGNNYWYNSRGLHRHDGPAIELSNGVKEWWIHNKLIVELEPKKNK